MKKVAKSIVLLICMLFMVLCSVQVNAGVCDSDGVQSSGAVYRICMPDPAHWNQDLVVFAPGVVAPNKPLAIPEDQLYHKDGSYTPEKFNDIGYAFAVSSYSTTGLAVKEGINDLCELVQTFTSKYGEPRYVYLFGVSQGALISVLALEKHPEIFDGGLAASGMIGDYYKHTNYLADFRVVFDYFFPGLIQGSPMNIPQEVINNWYSVYVPQIMGAIQTNPSAVMQLLQVTRVPFDSGDVTSITKSIISLLTLTQISYFEK